MLKKKIKALYLRLSVRNRPVLFAYALAVSNAIFILLANNAVAHILWNASPFLMFVPGIILTSWYGGFLPGLVATIVATIVGDYFFLNPLYTFTIADSADVARLFLFSTVGILLSIINQTFYNQKEEKEQLLHKLEQIENQKTKFLSMVAHELRTPLATVQLINELLISKFQKLNAQEEVVDLENMYEELGSLSQLIQELLQFVRGEQGKLSLHKEHIVLKRLIGRIVANYQNSNPQLSIIADIPSDYTIYADIKRIKQVLYNLLDNAVKVSPQKGKITIAVTKANHSIVFSVTDEGIGITPPEQKKIFRQYYQAKSASKYGFGLGLYIAKQIVEKHNGKIWVKSIPEKGSTFSFSLPS